VARAIRARDRRAVANESFYYATHLAPGGHVSHSPNQLLEYEYSADLYGGSDAERDYAVDLPLAGRWGRVATLSL
jgi:hypothetical protein